MTSKEAVSIIKRSVEFINAQGKPVVSISGTAEVTSPNGRNITEIHSAMGDRVLFRRTRPGQPLFTAVVNQSYAWVIDPETDEPEPLDSQGASFVLGHDFLMLPFVLAERFQNLSLVGESTFQNTHCLKIEAANKYGRNCDLFFAVATNRFLGLTLHGENTVHIHYANWAHLQDVLTPTLVIVTDPAGEYRFAFNGVTLNNVDEEIFSVPDTIKS